MLSRRNRPCPSRRSTSNPNPCNGLRPLEISCLSFCDFRPLFSIACSLLWQKRGGGYTLQTPPFGISSLRPLFSGPVCKRVISAPNSPHPRVPEATGHQSRLRSPRPLTPLSTAFLPRAKPRGTPSSAVSPLSTAFTPNRSLTPLSTAFTQTHLGVGVITPLPDTHYPPPTVSKIQSTTLTIRPSVRRWKPVNWPKKGEVVTL